MTWRRIVASLVLVSLVVSLAEAQATIARYREQPNGPVQFAYEQLHFDPDPWQREVLIAFGDPAKPRLSLQACAGPGKSAVMAICAWYFLSCFGAKHEHPNAVAVSITSSNLRDGFWKEMSKWQARSRYLTSAFTWTSSRIFANDHPSTWWLAARSWPRTGSVDEQGATLSGLHGRFVAAFCDESGAIPPTVLRAAEQALADRPWFGKVMQSGNPMSLDGMLYAAATKLRDQWHVVRVTGDPDDPMRSPRIDIEWARRQLQTYGRDNAWVQSYILGQFPSASLNTLLTLTDVEQAMERVIRPEAYAHVQKRLGIDAARFGDDKWVIFPRQGLQAFKPVDLRNPRTHEVVARIALAKQRWGSEREFFDDTGGFSAGAIDGLLLAGHSPTPINFSGKASDHHFFNKRSEMWFQMAEWVKRGGGLPSNVPELVDELVTPMFWYENAKFRLEEKDQIKKRLGRSPNYGDALALTFAEVDAPAQLAEALAVSSGRRTAVATEYDPFSPALPS